MCDCRESWRNGYRREKQDETYGQVILRRRHRTRHRKANRKQNLEWHQERGAWASDWFPIKVVSKGMAAIGEGDEGGGSLGNKTTQKQERIRRHEETNEQRKKEGTRRLHVFLYSL